MTVESPTKKYGKRLEYWQIDIIIDMTQSEKYDRPEIAKKAKISNMSVYNWQKKLNLI